jgi:uncharacterized protein
VASRLCHSLVLSNQGAAKSHPGSLFTPCSEFSLMVILSMNMKTALIILVHDSVPCAVKTGKIDTISEQESIAMRRQLLMHTQRVTINLVSDKFLFINEFSSGNDVWNKGGYIKRMQRGRSTGEIMLNAFEAIFSLGYSKVVMISSDSIETESTHLVHAFDNLNSYDIVIGPAQEGGYYLLGMKKMHPLLFKHKAWNTIVLLQQTLDDITELRLTYHLQQVLNDVEEEKEKYLLHHRQ